MKYSPDTKAPQKVIFNIKRAMIKTRVFFQIKGNKACVITAYLSFINIVSYPASKASTLFYYILHKDGIHIALGMF